MDEVVAHGQCIQHRFLKRKLYLFFNFKEIDGEIDGSFLQWILDAG
ncbi:hypothetical protein L665_02888 [Ralstonia solanacearum SD54]|nr:hypothetical protein F504_4320 [Ralstonia pseudosolanacearum FQY_4]ESS47733.1 hypothetical protein L665_02888 [Ralstonia solanacearum SD54]